MFLLGVLQAEAGPFQNGANGADGGVSGTADLGFPARLFVPVPSYGGRQSEGKPNRQASGI